MRELTKKHIEKFGIYLENEERSSATIERYTRDLEHFYDWMAKDDKKTKITLTKGAC